MWLSEDSNINWLLIKKSYPLLLQKLYRFNPKGENEYLDIIQSVYLSMRNSNIISSRLVTLVPHYPHAPYYNQKVHNIQLSCSALQRFQLCKLNISKLIMFCKQVTKPRGSVTKKTGKFGTMS